MDETYRKERAKREKKAYNKDKRFRRRQEPEGSLESAFNELGISVGDEVADDKVHDPGDDGEDGAGEEVGPDERYAAE